MIVAAWIIGGLIVAGFLAWLGLRRLGARMPTVLADEVHAVTTPDLWRVRLCRYKPKSGKGEPVFLCHGFMSNQFNFTLPDGQALVDYLTENGYDCWTIDLRGNLSSFAPFGRSFNDPTLDDYLLKDIPTALNFIRMTTGYGQVHWIGHSMGGMLLYAYDAVLRDGKIASGTAIGSPIGFEGVEVHNPWLLILVRRVLGRLAFRGGIRVLLPVFLRLKPQMAIVPVNFSNLHPDMNNSDTFYKAADTPPVRVATGLAQAANGNAWRVKDGEVDVYDNVSRMKTPLFAVFGAADPLVPKQAVDAFFEKVAAPDKKMLLLSKDNGFSADYSHLDLVFGRETQREVFQPVVDWLKAHPASQHEVMAGAGEAKPRKTSRKPAAKKRATRKTAAKKPAAKKQPAKKTAAKKETTKKETAKKPAAKKSTAKKTTAKKPVAKKPAAKKPAAKKPAAKKPAAKKTVAKKKPAPRKRSPKKSTGGQA